MLPNQIRQNFEHGENALRQMREAQTIGFWTLPGHRRGKNNFTLARSQPVAYVFAILTTFCQRTKECLFRPTRFNSAQLNVTGSEFNLSEVLRLQTRLRHGLAFKRLIPLRTLQMWMQFFKYKQNMILAMEKFGGIADGNTGEEDIYSVWGGNRGKLHGTGRIGDKP